MIRNVRPDASMAMVARFALLLRVFLCIAKGSTQDSVELSYSHQFDRVPPCPDGVEAVTFTCKAYRTRILRWCIEPPAADRTCISYPGDSVGTVKQLEEFEANLTESHSEESTITRIRLYNYTSSLTAVASQQLNGTRVTCEESMSGVDNPVSMVLIVAGVPNAPTNLQLFEEADHLLITWDAPAIIEYNQNLSINYTVAVSMSEFDGGNNYLQVTNTSVRISPLPLGQVYSISVFAENCAGVSAVATIEIDLPYRDPSSPVHVQQLHEHDTLTSTVLEWSPPDDNGGDMFITYTVEVFALENLTNVILNRSTAGLSVNLTGLTYNMEYVARVYARNSQKVGKSANLEVRISATVPPPPDEIKLYLDCQYQKYVYIFWKYPELPMGQTITPAVQRVLIVYTEEVNGTINTSSVVLDQTEEEGYLLQPIVPGAVYNVTVSLENVVGTSIGNPSKSIAATIIQDTENCNQRGDPAVGVEIAACINGSEQYGALVKYGHCSQPNSHDYELSIGGFGANGTSTSVPLWGVGNSSLDAYCYEVGIVLTRAVGETVTGTVSKTNNIVPTVTDEDEENCKEVSGILSWQMVAIAATLEALLFLFIGMLCGSLVTVILLKKKKKSLTNDNFETLGQTVTLPLTRVESQNVLSQVNDSLDLTLLELEQEEAVQNPVYDQIIVSETALDAERSVNARGLEASAECLYDFSNNTTESQPSSTNICLEPVESKITETKANLVSPVLGQRLVSPAQDTTDAPKSFKPPVLPPRTPKPDFPVSQTHIESKTTETKAQNFASPVLGQRPAQDTTDVSKSFKPPVLPPRTRKPDFPVSQTHIQISRKEVLKRKKWRKPSGAELIPEIKNGDSGTDESADANKVLSPIKLPPRNTSQPQHNISTQVNVSYKYLGPLGSEDGEKLGENQESPPHCLVSSSESSHHGNSESMPINANVSYKYLGPLDNTSEDEGKSAERGSTLDCFVGSGDHGITDPGLPVHSNSESMKFNSNVAYKYLGPLDEEADDQRIPEGHDHDVQSQNNYHLEPADSSEDREYVPKTEVAGDPPGEDQEPDENISVQLNPNVSYKYLGPLDEPQV